MGKNLKEFDKNIIEMTLKRYENDFGNDLLKENKELLKQEKYIVTEDDIQMLRAKILLNKYFL